MKTLSAFLYCGVYETMWLGTRHESNYCFAVCHHSLLRTGSEGKLPIPDGCTMDISALSLTLKIQYLWLHKLILLDS